MTFPPLALGSDLFSAETLDSQTGGDDLRTAPFRFVAARARSASATSPSLAQLTEPPVLLLRLLCRRLGHGQPR